MLYRYQATVQGKYRYCLYGLILMISLSSSPAFSGIHFTLQSSLSHHNMVLSAQDSKSGSASVAFDLGTYFRVGLTHRQAINQSRGYVYSEEFDAYEYRLEETRTNANSLDFTVILYYGQIFVPYIQIGGVKKRYHLVYAAGDQAATSTSSSLPIVPNGGMGMGIRLNRNFSLKLAVSVSPGMKKASPDAEIESVSDTFTSIGVSYNI